MRPRVLLVEALHPDATAWLREHAEVVVAPDYGAQTLFRPEEPTMRGNGP